MAHADKKLKELLKDWSNLDRYGYRTMAFRTTVYLAKVNDVPQAVMEALNKLTDLEFEGYATSIQTVVRYLRDLRQLDRLAFPKFKTKKITEKPAAIDSSTS